LTNEPLITGNLDLDQAIIDARLEATCDFAGDEPVPDLDWAVMAYLRALLTLQGLSHENINAFAITIYWLGRYAESLRKGAKQ